MSDRFTADGGKQPKHRYGWYRETVSKNDTALAVPVSGGILPSPAKKTSSHASRTMATGSKASEISPATGAERRSLTVWAGMIRQAWFRGADSTLELARLMSQARTSLPYGGWGQLWKAGEMPFSKRKGEKLVAIGQGLGGLDANDRSQLPAVFGALYYLAQLGQTVVEEFIWQRLILPGMSVGDARALLPEGDSESQRKNLPTGFKARLARLTALIRAEIGNWPEEQRKLVHTQLLGLANEIHGEKPINGAGACEAPTGLLNSWPCPQIVDKPSDKRKIETAILKTTIRNLLAVIFIAASFQTHAQGFVYDQQSATGPVPVVGNGNADGLNIQPEPLTQSFVPTLSAIAFAELELADIPNNGNNGATVYVDLWTGSPNINYNSATLLGSTVPVYMPNGFNNDGLSVAGITNFYFSTPIALTPGQTYYLQPVVLSGDNPWDVITIGPTYANGQLFVAGEPFNNDLWFREGVVVPEPTTIALIGLSGILAYVFKRRSKPFIPQRPVN